MAEPTGAEPTGAEAARHIPAGFAPITHSAAFGAMIGPIYERTGADGFVRAFRVEERHTNGRGVLHGGMLLAFADIVLAQAGLVAGAGAAATVRMATEFIAPGSLGDWVEGRARVSRKTGSLIFTFGEISVGDRPLMTASGLFMMVGGRSAAANAGDAG